jgi:hypothetical protein
MDSDDKTIIVIIYVSTEMKQSFFAGQIECGIYFSSMISTRFQFTKVGPVSRCVLGLVSLKLPNHSWWHCITVWHTRLTRQTRKNCCACKSVSPTCVKFFHGDHVCAGCSVLSRMDPVASSLFTYLLHFLYVLHEEAFFWISDSSCKNCV